MNSRLRMTGKQHALLLEHLHPPDGSEAVALLLCGRCSNGDGHTLLVHRIVLIPYEACSERSPVRVTWPTSYLIDQLQEVTKRGWAVVKIHSHPTGVERFSDLDDSSDRDLFESVESWLDDGLPHGSAIMLPNGRVFGRIIADGAFHPMDCVAVAGDDLSFWFSDCPEALVGAAADKNTQAFGPGTVSTLGRLKVGIVGCSGTGSPLVEMLARLGVGTLVLVDPDPVEEKNLNRIINSTKYDAKAAVKKVFVMERAIDSMGLGTRVVAIDREIADRDARMAIASCDVVFGCVDSIDGRYLLNRLAACYLLPYFDVGVRLEADGKGGINEIIGTVHYLQPDCSSLMSRGLFTPQQLMDANLKKGDPEEFARRELENYVTGAQVERPAVISVNMFYASLAVNEFLARIHGFRFDDNSEFAIHQASLAQGWLMKSPDPGASSPCPDLMKIVGRGDMSPPLNMSELSQ